MLHEIKRIKLLYQLYNFFHPSKLKHIQAAYKKWGIRKAYFSSISTQDLQHLPPTAHSTVNKTNLHACSIYKQSEETIRQSLDAYDDSGFVILPKYFSADVIDQINKTVDSDLKQGKLHYVNHNKIMFAFRSIPELKQMGSDPDLLELLEVLLHGKPMLFQSINFTMGSEQHTHSDSFHMSTYPVGGLLGVWIALETIDCDNGPLHYYPGSHKLPYYTNSDYNNQGNRFLLGPKDYDEYETFIAQKMEEAKLEKKIFKAEKGDVLIWHANLFHGGEPHLNKSKTRNSVVFHYFQEGCICYHEITQRPALMD